MNFALFNIHILSPYQQQCFNKISLMAALKPYKFHQLNCSLSLASKKFIRDCKKKRPPICLFNEQTDIKISAAIAMHQHFKVFFLLFSLGLDEIINGAVWYIYIHKRITFIRQPKQKCVTLIYRKYRLINDYAEKCSNIFKILFSQPRIHCIPGHVWLWLCLLGFFGCKQNITLASIPIYFYRKSITYTVQRFCF